MPKCKICGDYFEKGEGVTDFEDISKPEYCSEECYEQAREQKDAQFGGFVGKARRFHQKLGLLIIVAIILWAVMSDDDSEKEPPQEPHENTSVKVQD